VEYHWGTLSKLPALPGALAAERRLRLTVFRTTSVSIAFRALAKSVTPDIPARE